MNTRPHPVKRALALLLAFVMTISLLSVGASASSIEDGSRTATMTLGKGQFYLRTTAGTTLGAWGYTYTTDDGLTGPAYCVNHGLHFTNRTLPIEGKYTTSPQTAGVYANGYPQHSLDTFLWLYLNDNPILSGLTEDEYAYATQLAVWASLGQLGIDGTGFTSGREFIAEPTGDTRQMRVFRAVQLLLEVGATWTMIPQTGMYIRTNTDQLGGNLSIPADMTLEYAADNENYGIKREVIDGRSYYTREYTFASATSTYYDGYNIELWAEGAPGGYMFTDLNNHELARRTFRETATWTLPTKNKPTTLNENGFEYVGTAKLCIPVDTVPNSGEITICCASYVMQYSIFLAKNEVAAEQSYIIADPSKTDLRADAVLNWGGPITETGTLEVRKVDGSGNPLAGAVFTLSGTDGSTLTGTSGADGKITWEYLKPEITYTLTETTPPAGYGIADPITLNIMAARTNYVTVRDTVEKQLTVHKQDAQNGYSLVGAVIAFEQIDGSFYTTRTTDHAGNIQLDADQLPIGSYKVYEVSSPEGYETDPTPQTVNWDGLRDVTLTFTNVRKPTLAIYKCDEGNHRSLPYATFEVYKNGQLVTAVTTNENGLAYVPGVTTGYYTVKETAAPAGYVLDPTEHSVYVDLYDPATTDDPRIVITNAVKPTLRITKYDAQTQERLANTTFAVYRDTELVGQYVTDANGDVYLRDLDPGTYLVREIAAPDTHVVNSTPQEIELAVGDNGTLVFLNYLKPGIFLTKLDSQTCAPLANARFKVSQVGRTFAQEYLTGANGEIELTALEPGSYTVEELDAPENYLIDDAVRTIRIEGGENAVFVFTDTVKPSLSVVKYDSEREKLLSGAVFRVSRIEDGSHYLDRITDMQGQFTIQYLDPGVYSVQELSAPGGYVRNEFEYHVELFAGQTSRLVVTNQEKPDLKIVKRDADTGAALSGAVFTIKKVDSSTLTTKTTDQNGEILLRHLDPGVYQITEKTPPTGYLPAEKPTQLITLVPDKTGEVVFENHIKPSLTVRKIDSITGDGIQGAKFRVTYGSNQTFTGELNDLGYYYSDENGQFSVTGLRDGWYKVTEVTPPTGYSPDAEPQEFYLKAGESKTVTFEDVPLSALVVFKYDSVTGEAVKDAVFQVKYLSGTSGTGGTVIGTYKTSANGSFTVTGLEAGAYVIEELASDSGHVIDTAPQTAFVSGNPQAVVQLYFGNTPKGSVLITKKDAVTLEPISGVEFTVTDSAGTFLGDVNGKFTTDSAGSILIDNLAPGTTLVVKETRAKSGYVLDDTPQTIQVKAGKTVTLEFRNQPKGGLIIEKYDAVTKERLAGAVFRITNANGELIADNEGLTSTNGLYTTNTEGQIVLPKVTPATLVVTEVTAPDNYRLDPTPQTVVVGAGDTQTLRFYDDPLCTLTILKRDANTKKPLAKAEFTVKYSDGAYVGSNNGRFVTGTDGTVTVSGLKPDATVIVTETKAPLGYLISESAKSVIVRSGVANSLTFDDEPATTLVIRKYIEGTDYEPLAGACFKVTDGSGAAVGPDDGTYYTDAAGEIVLTGLEPGITVKAREIKTVEGYVLDGTPQDILIKSGEVQTLTFWNKKAGTLVIRKLSGADRKTPLAGAEFQLTYADGGYVDNANGKLSSNGKYTTDSNGEIRITGVTGTIVATETKAPDGYTIGTDRTQTVVVRTGETQTLTFYNDPYQTVVIQKYIDGTTKPLAGVTFLLTDGNGNKIGNGEYKTDANGRITLSVPVGTTIIAREAKTVEGYVLDTTPQTITVKGGSAAQTVTTTSAVVVSDGSAANQLTFYDSTIGKLELIKVDAANKGMRLADATFEIRRMDQGVVTTVTTGRNGRAVVELDAGSYYAVETEAPEGHKLDATPTYFTVEDGKTTTVTVTNIAYSSITIHKTDAVTGEGIYGVSFLLYDARNNVVGQYTSDNKGYVRIEDIEAGRYRIRELENEGYILDTQLKTVEVKSGEVTLVEWENTPITGQIQITKTSADYNSVNGWAAGTPIPNTVFEVYNRAGRLVDTIQTDKNGVAATKPLPLGRYKLIESKAAEFYVLDKTPVEVEIEYAGQTVRAAMTNRSLYTNVSITKRGYVEVMPGQMIRYDFSNIANNSTTALESFYFRDTIPASAVRLDTIVTGTWNVRGNYKIVYRTNLSNGYLTLADNLSATRSYVLNASPAALGLAANEYVTEVMYTFGVVPSNFRQVEAPQIYCMVLNTLTGGSQFTNTADVGGVYDGQWITAADRWVTRVYAPVKPLPRTGY